jgi:hypothetical protein
MPSSWEQQSVNLHSIEYRPNPANKAMVMLLFVLEYYILELVIEAGVLETLLTLSEYQG